MPALAHARRDVPRFLNQNPTEPPLTFRPRPHASPVVLDGHTEAALRHAAIAAGIELDVFTPLGTGPLPVEGVADALGLEAGRLLPLLEALTLTGLLLRQGDLYLNAPEAGRYLVRGSGEDLRGRFLLGAASVQAAAALVGRIRGEAEHDERVGTGDASSRDVELARLEAERAASRLALAFHLGQHQRLLEIGAGGGIAIGACRVHPDLQALIAVPEAALAATRRRVEEAALDRRIRVAVASAETPPLAECDVVLVWDVVGPRPRGSLLDLLNGVSSAVIPGARLHQFAWIRDDRGAAPAGAMLRALASERPDLPPSEGDVRGTLLQAGYFDVVRRPAPSGIGPHGLSHLAARKA